MKTLQTGLIASVTERALAEAPASAADIIALGEIMNHNVEALKRELAEQIGALDLATDLLSGDVLGAEDVIQSFEDRLDTMASDLDTNFDRIKTAFIKQEKRIKDLEESVARLIEGSTPPKDPATSVSVSDVERVFSLIAAQSNIFPFSLRNAA